MVMSDTYLLDCFNDDDAPFLVALVIAVDNGDSDAVYPQMADFTFYGGLYRAVQLLCVDPVHFTLDDHGGPGLAITPEVQGDTARVHLEAAVTGRRDYVPAL